MPHSPPAYVLHEQPQSLKLYFGNVTGTDKDAKDGDTGKKLFEQKSQVLIDINQSMNCSNLNLSRPEPKGK